MPETPAPLNTPQVVGKILRLGAEVALGLVPGGGTAAALAPIAVRGVFALYDELMAQRPPGMTEADFRALLESRMMTATGDDFLNAAREAAAGETPLGAPGTDQPH